MAKRKSAAGPARVDITPVKREFIRVWRHVDEENAHPFGPGRPYPDFQSWCAGRAALGESFETFKLIADDFKEVEL